MSTTLDTDRPGLTAKYFDAAEINLEPGEPAAVAWLTLDNVDREGDVVIPKGVDYRSEYLDTNPVVMAVHDYQRWPVGRCDWIKPRKNRGFNGLLARTVFDVDDPDTRRLFGIVQRKVVRSVSIGFRPPDDFKPGDWGPPTAEELKARPDWANARRIIRRCVLIEYSVVPIGMNAQALIVAVAKGLELPSYLTPYVSPKGKAVSDTPRETADETDGGILTTDELRERSRVHKAIVDVAKSIKHSGDYGMAFHHHEKAAVHWTMADGDGGDGMDGSDDIKRKFLAIDDVKSVEIGDEWSPKEEGGWVKVYPEHRKALTESSGTDGGYVTEAAKPTADNPDPDHDGDDDTSEEGDTDHDYKRLKAGDYVEHGMGRNAIVGKIVSVHKSGFVPGVEEDVEGSEDEPAARVKRYMKSEATGKYHPTTKHVGRMCRELTKVAHPMAEGEDMPYPEGDDAPKSQKVSTASAIKGVVPFKTGPVDDASWDAAEARNGLAKWASSDGSGSLSTIDWSKYEQGFAWCDGERKESVGGYKLPHHCVKDGKLFVSKRGVEAAYAAIDGARGGMTIPESDRAGVKAHLAKHYAEWGAVPGKDGKSLVVPPHKTVEQLRAEIEAKAARQFGAESLTQAVADAVIDRQMGAV